MTISPDPGPPPTRWETTMTGRSWTSYRQRFADLVGSGADLDGEARFLDALLARNAAVLDGGCGTGRNAAALHARGHRVVGVDRDAGLIAAAREWYPDVDYLVGDLLALTTAALEEIGAPSTFDIVALPGNVLVFVAPGTERAVLRHLATFLTPRGRIVAGFATDRDYTVAALDVDAEALGLTVEHRFATWDLEPWHPDADWAVTVLRRR